MAKRMIRGFLIKKESDRFGDYIFEYSKYTDIYPLINCDCFTIVTRKFGDHYLDIICDDEGLLKKEQYPSIATFDNGKLVEVIVNSCFICKHNDAGDMVSLNNDEKKSVNDCIVLFNGNKVLEATL